MVQSVRCDRARCIRDRNPIARPRFFIPRGNARAPVINRAGRGRRPTRKTAPGCGRTPQRGGWLCAPFVGTGPVGFTIGGGAIWVRGREPRQQNPTEPTAPHAVAVCTDAPPLGGQSAQTTPPSMAVARRRRRRNLLSNHRARGGQGDGGGSAPPSRVLADKISIHAPRTGCDKEIHQ